jgi:hypothetical protein
VVNETHTKSYTGPRLYHNTTYEGYSHIFIYNLNGFLKQKGHKQLLNSRVNREGTNSIRLFTPRERNALAKSKVHQISRAHGVWVVISLILAFLTMTNIRHFWVASNFHYPMQTIKTMWKAIFQNKLTIYKANLPSFVRKIIKSLADLQAVCQEWRKVKYKKYM